MYEFLLKWFNKKYANIFIFLWYLLLLFMVFYFIHFENGRFKYVGFELVMLNFLLCRCGQALFVFSEQKIFRASHFLQVTAGCLYVC